MIVSVFLSSVEERKQVIILTYVRGRMWSFMMNMFVSWQTKCSVSVFTLNKVNRNHGCRLILFKPNLIQIFHRLNTFLWDIWGELDLDSCTTGASAESTGFWFLSVFCWMLILSVFQSITHSFSHSARVLILQENRHFCGKEEKMIECV